MLFPVVAAVIVASAVVSSPLLPLLGLPLFVVGFPRPRRHWPNVGSGPESTALEAAYYQQASPALLKSLISAAASGSLGAGIAGGEFFLLRRDTLLVLVQVPNAVFSALFLSSKATSWACRSLRIQPSFGKGASLPHTSNSSTHLRGPDASSRLTLACTPLTVAHISSCRYSRLAGAMRSCRSRAWSFKRQAAITLKLELWRKSWTGL